MRRVYQALGAFLLVFVSLHAAAFEEVQYRSLDEVGTGARPDLHL